MTLALPWSRLLVRRVAPAAPAFEVGRSSSASTTYVGELEGAVLRSGRLLETPLVAMGIDDELGLVTALTRADLHARRFLVLDRSQARKAIELRYYRDRRAMGHPIPDWFHETRRTLIDPTGAVHSPSMRLCDLDGDFLCGG